MRHLILLFFLLSSAYASAQVSKIDLLTSATWKLESDEMSGVGVHSSLPKGITLQFRTDGIWESSELIMNTKNGKWSLENDRTLVMEIGDEEVKYLIQTLTDASLQYRLKKNAATFTYQWQKMR